MNSFVSTNVSTHHYTSETYGVERRFFTSLDDFRDCVGPLDITVEEAFYFTAMASEDRSRVELLQGTLDLIVLRALATMGPQHAYGLAARLEQVADHPLSLNQGTLYPALVRLEQKGWIKGAWQTTENNREAKYYTITRAGGRALESQTERWRRLAGLVDKLLLHES